MQERGTLTDEQILIWNLLVLLTIRPGMQWDIYCSKTWHKSSNWLTGIEVLSNQGQNLTWTYIINNLKKIRHRISGSIGLAHTGYWVVNSPQQHAMWRHGRFLWGSHLPPPSTVPRSNCNKATSCGFLGSFAISFPKWPRHAVRCCSVKVMATLNTLTLSASNVMLLPLVACCLKLNFTISSLLERHIMDTCLTSKPWLPRSGNSSGFLHKVSGFFPKYRITQEWTASAETSFCRNNEPAIQSDLSLAISFQPVVRDKGISW